MRASSILIALSSATLSHAQNATTGKLGDALVVTNNPSNATYIAIFPNATTSNIRGDLTATTDASGKGIHFTLDIVGLPAIGGPFTFHLHDQPVPANGNCTATLAHLDPFQRGQTPPCDASAPQTCEVGDLSGKHGKINGTSAVKSFTDSYAALVPGIGAFFGNRSVVVHNANTTRLTCANFTMLSTGNAE